MSTDEGHDGWFPSPASRVEKIFRLVPPRVEGWVDYEFSRVDGCGSWRGYFTVRKHGFKSEEEAKEWVAKMADQMLGKEEGK